MTKNPGGGGRGVVVVGRGLKILEKMDFLVTSFVDGA